MKFRGRLDEKHLQRHFYYYAYRAKYPDTHPQLLFIANRIVPQHKEFLDDHGYEFQEYPENEFARKATVCIRGHDTALDFAPEQTETPGVLPPRFRNLVSEIEMQEMVLCYKMLLLVEMADLADANGRVSLAVLAERFSVFSS